MTASIGQGHQVLGKILKLCTLSGTELSRLKTLFECMDDRKGIVYGRVLIAGTLYSSAMYNRSDVTNDSIISLSGNGGALIGTVQKYVSCCQRGCTSCGDDAYCKHFAIVAIHPAFAFGVVDSVTNATASHVQRILKTK